MKTILVLSLVAAAVAAPFAVAAHPPKADNRAAIQALEDQFAAAVQAKNLDGIMKVYAPGSDLFVFDVVPPRQYVGADAYRKDWKGFLDTFKGPIKFTVSDLAIDAGGKMAYSHSIQHISGTDTKGKPVDMTVRVTDVYRKSGGDWLIVHEHVSVPVNMDTGKPDMTSAP
ncbi:MAG TPA: nuclear transport factor 2 family protein [Rhizomicrobium sp.]|nr:nuclear transport factor 2 family protein [Rhizomicrobium sp.]